MRGVGSVQEWVGRPLEYYQDYFSSIQMKLSRLDTKLSEKKRVLVKDFLRRENLVVL